jgi:hypothetical protein
MSSSIRDPRSADLESLLTQEQALAAKAADMDAVYAGLKDLDVMLGLAEVRLRLCLHMMDRLARGEAPEGTRESISEKALSAMGIVDALLAENLSEDQKDAVSRDPRFSPVKERLQEFIIAGGADFLEARAAGAGRREALARGIVASMRKYAGTDDRYQALDAAEYPPIVRRILLRLFPASIREHPAQPPYGIEEGEETVSSSQNMKLPISQAILYMEDEMLPEMRKKLEESPGNKALQEEIRGMERKVEEYKKLRFFPRSVPVLLEQNYYTEGLTIYADNGEMLVPIPLAVSMKSGTNLDRKMELVKADLVKRLAGRGISPELDEEYRRLKSLESGTQGSSRTASMRLDPAWGFRALKSDYPALARLEDKRSFQEIAEIAATGSVSKSAKRLSSLFTETDSGANLPRLT